MTNPIPSPQHELEEIEAVYMRVVVSTPSSIRTALRDMLIERMNQIGEGYTPEHDALHGVDHLLGEVVRRIDPHSGERIPRSSLVAAGALIIAALELDARTEQDED